MAALPPISIVVPVFNRAAALVDAIESCLAQSYGNIEIIVVDDASTDDVGGALRRFAEDARLRLIRHACNEGVSAARNTGVGAAEGDYVAFLDSDDAWLPAKLEVQWAAVARARDPERTLCTTRTRIELGGGATRIRPDAPKAPGLSVGDYLFVEGGFAQTSSFLLSRRLAASTPFRVPLRQYEDYAFLIDLEANGADFVLVEEPLTVWRNDARPGRLGARDDLARGHRFLAEVGARLTPRARLAFEATHLAHLEWRERPGRALALVARALGGRAISPRSAIAILSRCVVGQARHAALRDAVIAGRAGLCRRRPG